MGERFTPVKGQGEVPCLHACVRNTGQVSVYLPESDWHVASIHDSQAHEEVHDLVRHDGEDGVKEH